MRYFLYKTLRISNIIHTFAPSKKENNKQHKIIDYERSKGIRRFKEKIS